MRAGHAGPVGQPRPALALPAAPPPPCRRPGYPHLRGHVRRWAPRRDALDQDQPPCRGQAGVSVRHERPPWPSGMPSDSSTPDSEVAPTSTTVVLSTSRAAESAPRAGPVPLDGVLGEAEPEPGRRRQHEATVAEDEL